MLNSTTKFIILQDAYQKLDALPLAFGLPKYTSDMSENDLDKYLGIDYKDTLRELYVSDVSGFEAMSNDELHIENRVVCHALRRFRNSASVFFKFSTATDGQTIDKQQIPKMLQQVITEYDADWQDYRGKNVGNLWNRGAS